MVTVALPPVDGASVRLWWPAGMGEQALYSIAVSAQVIAANANANGNGDGNANKTANANGGMNANGNGGANLKGNGNGNRVATPTVEVTRRVGFRVVYLVTTDDANPAAPTAEGCVPYRTEYSTAAFGLCNQLSRIAPSSFRQPATIS